jgi:UDP-glucose 4-epimerase
MKNIIVFGGSGFLGSYVVDALNETRKYHIIVADLQKGKYIPPNVSFEKCSITQMEQVKALLEKYKPEIVYNFAALAAIDEAYDKPVETMQVNVMGNLNLLEACVQNYVKHFIYASSAYAVNTKGSFYGISKHTSEKLIEEYHKRFGLNFTIIRYGSLYGERADKNNYIYNMLKQAILSQELDLKGDGNEEREYIHAMDAAILSTEILNDEKFLNEHFILTGVEKLKRKDLFLMVSEILNGEIAINQIEKEQQGHYKITPYEFHPYRAKKLVANPYIDMGQGLVECMKSIYDELGRGYEE